MSTATVIDHPLVQHKLTIMRDKETSTSSFRQLLREIEHLMCYEVTRDLALTEITIETPIAEMRAPTLACKKLVFCSILRAGNGLLEGMLDLVPSARVAHIGLYRDPKTLIPVEYYFKALEDLEDRLVIVIDPMLATANSSIVAVQRLKERGGRQEPALRLPAGGARRRQEVLRSPSRSADLHRRDRREAERARLYRSRSRRRGRSNVRHEIGLSALRGGWGRGAGFFRILERFDSLPLPLPHGRGDTSASCCVGCFCTCGIWRNFITSPWGEVGAHTTGEGVSGCPHPPDSAPSMRGCKKPATLSALSSRLATVNRLT